MKRNVIKPKGRMFIETYEAEYIEQKVARITESNEPITDGAQMIYTNAKDGVVKAYDIRTDKWEVAQDAMNSVNKQRSIEANNVLKGLNEANKKTEENNKTTPQLEAENG